MNVQLQGGAEVSTCNDVAKKFLIKPNKRRSCLWVSKKVKKKGIDFCNKDNVASTNIADHCPVTCEKCGPV
jgi:hypothetical protein